MIAAYTSLTVHSTCGLSTWYNHIWFKNYTLHTRDSKKGRTKTNNGDASNYCNAIVYPPTNDSDHCTLSLVPNNPVKNPDGTFSSSPRNYLISDFSIKTEPNTGRRNGAFQSSAPEDGGVRPASARSTGVRVLPEYIKMLSKKEWEVNETGSRTTKPTKRLQWRRPKTSTNNTHSVSLASSSSHKMKRGITEKKSRLRFHTTHLRKLEKLHVHEKRILTYNIHSSNDWWSIRGEVRWYKYSIKRGKIEARAWT